ncbi:hypothetical protein [Polluticoccus soli]|uniref:hypothetical protein n=1 Tax=Polluticoccus soli TaxID=3034150 RepID=UPI0023E30AC5|nr:hypothetical protein [Flavipsychrobacter sp. JY13-12]
MKHLSSIVLSAMLTCLMFSAVLYSSCSKSIDKCETVVCKNGGTCTDGLCKCPTGYEGAACETQTDLCKDVNCLNGGKCFAGNCNCPTNFTGKYCEIDLCAGLNCNNGNCHLGKCVCDTGYYGAHCDSLYRDKYIGSWNGTSTCAGNDPVTVSVTSSSATSITVQYTGTDRTFSVGLKADGTGKFTMKEQQQISGYEKAGCTMTSDGTNASFGYYISNLQTGTGLLCSAKLVR